MIERTGYDKLARFMVNDQYAIFRQFRSSANRDLLFLQAEITHLEEEFLALSARDKNIEGEHELHDRNWYLLSTAQDRGCGGEQWEKALQIRKKLQEYCPKHVNIVRIVIADNLADDFASRYSDIISKPQARMQDLTMLRDWISRPDLGGGIAFSGNDLSIGRGSVYDDQYADDLMALNSRIGENDPFTQLLSGFVFHKFERFWRFFKVSITSKPAWLLVLGILCLHVTTPKKPIPSDPENPASESNLFQYSDSHILGVIEILGTVVSSLIPLISIIILYFVGNLGYRLAVLCTCTLIFSTSLAVVTKARRIEVFAATAASVNTPLLARETYQLITLKALPASRLFL